MPLLTVIGTNNVWLQGVNLAFGITEASKTCKFGLIGPGKEFSDLTCPGVYIINSYGIQINQVHPRDSLCRPTRYLHGTPRVGGVFGLSPLWNRGKDF